MNSQTAARLIDFWTVSALCIGDSMEYAREY